jgi:hypothetical protein
VARRGQHAALNAITDRARLASCRRDYRAPDKGRTVALWVGSAVQSRATLSSAWDAGSRALETTSTSATGEMRSLVINDVRVGRPERSSGHVTNMQTPTVKAHVTFLLGRVDDALRTRSQFRLLSPSRARRHTDNRAQTVPVRLVDHPRRRMAEQARDPFVRHPLV